MSERGITGKAKVAGVMGWPVGHSLSPRMHGYWLRRYGIDGVYIPMAVAPENLETAINSLPLLGFKGCNLTVPHKENVLKCSSVASVEATARRIGAANTLVVGGGGSIEARNTDAYGFAESVKAIVGESLSGGTAVVLGAGGAARAVVTALQDMGCAEIRVVNRGRDRALKLAADLGRFSQAPIKPFVWDEIGDVMEGSDILVNATSLGMDGQPPLNINLEGLPKRAMVADIVYSPLETALLRQAREGGRVGIDGLGMLLHQAKAGFAAWFGIEPEVDDDLRKYVLAGL